jgi:C4-dicarboxylate transporter DctM subunit
MQQLPSALVSGSQSWVLLAIPAFVFAGGLMERCGMSHALVEFARSLVGWVRGGLEMSVIVVAYFFSDICGSKMAEVSALGSLADAADQGRLQEGRLGLDERSRNRHGHAGAARHFHDRDRAGHQHLGRDAVSRRLRSGLRHYDLPDGTRVPAGAQVQLACRHQAELPSRWPRRCSCGGASGCTVVILGGFFFGIITATEAGAVVAAYAFLAAKLYYRNVPWGEMARIAYDSAILTAAVIFLLAVASVFQYLMGMQGVPKLLGEVLEPLKDHHWLFLFGTAFITMMFGMVLEGLPAAVVLIPVVFPIAERMGIHPIHFNIVQTAAVGIGLFLPPMGVGLLMALKFADLTVGQHFRTYVPYIFALLLGLTLIICVPEISLTLPRLAGLIR